MIFLEFDHVAQGNLDVFGFLKGLINKIYTIIYYALKKQSISPVFYLNDFIS